jgi:predicted nucleotidyltransferase
VKIEKINTPDGVKLKDVDSGKLLGSEGVAKNDIPTPATPSPTPNIVEDKPLNSVQSSHDRFVSRTEKPSQAENSVRPNFSVGNRDIALKNEILRTLVGSEVVGMAIEGKGDRDEMGVYFETPEQIIGLEPNPEHYSQRSVPDGERSKPGDTDLTIHSMRKYMKLAIAGNPSILTILFAPDSAILVDTPLGRELRALTPYIISQNAGRSHLGYLDSQRDNMLGKGRKSGIPFRPELIEAHGYDSKFASHALRLGLQGIELTTTGLLTLPMAHDDLQRCLRVKRGEASFKEALAEVDEVRAELRSIIDGGRSKLRQEPDTDRVNAWMVDAWMRHWGKK